MEMGRVGMSGRRWVGVEAGGYGVVGRGRMG